ncbi:hypothetical protein XH88_06530 [Bradyrhizobium sp. CCBAU 51627]|nr:hypothetical protein [Bradyrhizobium sp. CCBAU 51627]
MENDGFQSQQSQKASHRFSVFTIPTVDKEYSVGKLGRPFFCIIARYVGRTTRKVLATFNQPLDSLLQKSNRGQTASFEVGTVVYRRSSADHNWAARQNCCGMIPLVL